MKIQARQSRPGYTLLEVLAAAAISLMLLGALYVSFNLTMNGTGAGRTLVAESELSLAIVNRMNIDFAGTLGPLPPKSGGITESSSSSSSSTSSSTSSTASSTSSTSSTSSSSSSTSSTDTSSSSSSTTTPSTTTTTNLPLQMGIYGTNTELSLFVAKVPTWLSNRDPNADPSAQVGPDIRRVTYYMSSDGRGLCRQERQWVTADNVGTSTDADRSTEADDLIAPEVTSVSFEYASGTGYVSAWDGAQSGLDGSSAQGPPRAIKVTFTMELTDDGKPVTRTIVHVFAIRAAVGTTPPVASTEMPDTTSGSGTSTGSTTGGP